MSNFAQWPTHALPLEIVIHLVSTVTAAFRLQLPKMGEMSNFSSLLACRDASAFGLLGAPHLTFLCSWTTWWRLWEKKEDTSELQEHCTPRVQSHCNLTFPLELLVSGEHQEITGKVSAGGPGIFPVFDNKVHSPSVSTGERRLQTEKAHRAHRHHRYFLFKWLPFCLAQHREMLVFAGHWKRYRSEYFPSDYGNFPLLLSKIFIINLKAEGG